MNSSNKVVNIFCQQALEGLDRARPRITRIADSLRSGHEAQLLLQLTSDIEVVINIQLASKYAASAALESLATMHSELNRISQKMDDIDAASYLLQVAKDILIVANTKNALLGFDQEESIEKNKFKNVIKDNFDNINIIQSHPFYNHASLAYAQGSLTMYDAVKTIVQLCTESNPETGMLDIEEKMSTISI